MAIVASASSRNTPRKNSRRRKNAMPGHWARRERQPISVAGGRRREPAEAAHGHALDALERRIDVAERLADRADVLAHVVAVAARLDDLEQLVVRHHLPAPRMQRREDALRG